MFHLVLTVQLLAVITSAFPSYRERIPNGLNVPHPCKGDNPEIWKGVGHKNQNGGGETNPFGLAFHAAGKKWTKELCEADSDRDGKTNGFELGDPQCIWISGEIPEGPALSHPGICDPVDSSRCIGRNDWAVCDQKQFECDGIHEPGVRQLNLQFESTEVPPTETNYYCQIFRLPSDQDYHIVADKPILDNTDLIHHMILYACPTEANIDSLLRDFTVPGKCGMLVQSECSHTIGGWTVGNVGTCYDNIEAGTRIGNTSFQYAILEVHWNNPSEKHGESDASGMTIWYTNVLKPFDLGVLTVGQAGLKLPPGLLSFEDTSTCSSECTTKMLGDTTLKVASVGLHMHYLGIRAHLELIRNGRSINLGEDNPFIYDRPEEHDHFPVIEVKAGDELKTTCFHNTMNQNEFTYYGAATSDEMCFAFITYYPKINFNHCMHFGQTELCNEYKLRTVKGCDMENNNDSLWNELAPVYHNCDRTGRTCTAACKGILSGKRLDVCFHPDALKYIQYWLPNEEEIGGVPLLKALRSCDKELYLDSDNDNGAANKITNRELVLAILIIALIVVV